MNDKTAVFFISDHGNNMPTIGKLIGAEDELLERALGNLILLIPNEFNQTQINNLKYNQQILVTPYDIYETLLDMSVYDKLWGSENNKGESLFNKINGLERDCENMMIGIKENNIFEYVIVGNINLKLLVSFSIFII